MGGSSSRSGPTIRRALERVDHWIGVGAQPSDRVRNLINTCRRLGAAAPEAAVAPAAEPKAEESAEAGA